MAEATNIASSVNDRVRASLQSKSVLELKKLKVLLKANADELRLTLGELAVKTEEQKNACKAHALEIEQISQTLEPANAQLNAMQDQKTELEDQLRLLHARLSGVEGEIKRICDEIAQRKENMTQLLSSVEQLEEFITISAAKAPQVQGALTETMIILQEVEAILLRADGNGKPLSADHMLYNHNALIGSLLRDSKEARSEDSGIFRAADAENDETEEEEESQDFDFRGEEGEEYDPDGPSSIKRYKPAKSSKREEPTAKMSVVRSIFRKQHGLATKRANKIVCFRRPDGQWAVSDEDRAKYEITGCQGTRSGKQGFNVRFRNQVFSSKILNSNLEAGEKPIEAVFEDPRDASDVYQALSSTFS